MYISASAPDAPPFSETTIGCFIRLFFWIAACVIRAIWSEGPPAPAATTISTGFGGLPHHDLDRFGRLPGQRRSARQHGRKRDRRFDPVLHVFVPEVLGRPRGQDS